MSCDTGPTSELYSFAASPSHFILIALVLDELVVIHVDDKMAAIRQPEANCKLKLMSVKMEGSIKGKTKQTTSVDRNDTFCMTQICTNLKRIKKHIHTHKIK